MGQGITGWVAEHRQTVAITCHGLHRCDYSSELVISLCSAIRLDRTMKDGGFECASHSKPPYVIKSISRLT
jgi:hypothetical protein